MLQIARNSMHACVHTLRLPSPLFPLYLPSPYLRWLNESPSKGGE